MNKQYNESYAIMAIVATFLKGNVSESCCQYIKWDKQIIVSPENNMKHKMQMQIFGVSIE